MKKGDKVKLKGIVTRGIDKNGYIIIDIEGTERKNNTRKINTSVKAGNVKKRWI